MNPNQNPPKALPRIFILLLFLQLSVTALAQNNDINILRDVYNNRNTSLDDPMLYLSRSVTPVSMALPLTLLATGYIKDDTEIWHLGVRSALGVGSAVTFSYILKHTVDRNRPYEKYPEIQPITKDFTSSFPSGHTTSAFATATTLTMISKKWYVLVPAWGYAAGVAYSRLHLGMHYPTDILAGALIGSGCSFLSFKINKLLRKDFMYPRNWSAKRKK